MKYIPRFLVPYRSLILYGIIGSFSASMDFMVYTLLVHYVELHYLVSNCFSVFVGMVISFLLNRQYNFRVRDRILKRFVIFIVVGLSGLAASNAILWVCIEHLGIQSILAKLLSVGLVVLIQYFLNKTITFQVKE